MTGLDNAGREARHASYAKVVLSQSDALGYLRNISDSGCRLAFLEQLPIQIGTSLEMQVIPAAEMGSPAFYMTFIVQWTRPGEVFFTVGGRVDTFPSEEDRRSYDLLMKHWSVPEES